MAVVGGKGFWSLIPFTMQMAMIIIGGYVVASAPAVYWVIQRLASVPSTPSGAVAFVALFSMLTSLVSWGFSLIFSGLLVRELVRRVGVNLRAIGTAAYLGLGSIWAMGLSLPAAALLMATKGSIPPALLNISGIIPLTQRTIFLWESIITAAVLLTISVLIAYWSAPSPENAKTVKLRGSNLTRSTWN